MPSAGTGKHHLMRQSKADVIGLDWKCDMTEARQALGGRCVQGNVDPTVMLGPQKGVEQAVCECLTAAGPTRHILNVGDGVTPNIPEENVAHFVHCAKSFKHGSIRQTSELAIA